MKDSQFSDDQINQLIEEKYKLVFSEQLERNVHVLNDWIDKPVFKRHKKLFGYIDIGWTVKHPKRLIRELLKEGIWELQDGTS